MLALRNKSTTEAYKNSPTSYTPPLAVCNTSSNNMNTEKAMPITAILMKNHTSFQQLLISSTLNITFSNAGVQADQRKRRITDRSDEGLPGRGGNLTGA